MAQRGRRDRIRSTNDDDKLQAKPKHLRNAMFTLLLLFGGLVSFVFIMAPPDDPSAGINPQLEELVTKLIQIEKSSLRGPVSDKLESPVESSTHQTSVEAPQVQPVQTGLTLSRTESGSDAGCLEDVPVDTGKHIVTPPEGPVTLVCCQSTKGPLSIAVHKSWAPIGAQRFLDMVTSGFFSTKVGLFRALKGFLIQFGLPGDPKVLETWNKRGHLQDDPSWLPLGPTNREINGVKRYQKGYLGYAGAGKNSRGTQLIVAFEPNLYLGGGSPWLGSPLLLQNFKIGRSNFASVPTLQREVPFGQLVGEASFETLSQIYTGYGEKVSQGKIMNRGNAYLEEEFPLLDYILECKVLKEDVSS